MSVEPGRTTRTSAEGPRVLIIVQNLPVPLDRRVWLECLALRDRGYIVSVICPKGPGDPAFRVIEGIHTYKYRPAPAAQGVLGFLIEFVYSWIRTCLLSVRVRRGVGFDVIQACNPPDTYWLLARLWRIRGVRFIFDQHDLNPELFLSRFGEPSSLGARAQLRGLRWLERMTYLTADRVVSTNESYKLVAVTRGDKRTSDVTVVRSGPDTTKMRPVYPDPQIRTKGRHLLVYLGIMGPQDGVQTVLEVMDELVHKRGRDDVSAALLGFGDCFDELTALSEKLQLSDVVTFTGRANTDQIADYLSSADVGLCPDLKTPLNDVSTMNKTMEYMAYALPSVSFDLVETRISGADTVLYVPSGDVVGFANAVERLLDDPDLRLELGTRARRRVVAELDWKNQAERYVGCYDELLGQRDSTPQAQATHAEPDPTVSPAGRRYVDSHDEAEFSRFIIERSGPPSALV